jgi:hypothetical protein
MRLRKGTDILKGVTVRFEFDVLRISQVQMTGQRQSNGTPLGMIVSPLFGLIAGKGHYIIWCGAFALLVSTGRALREPLEREASIRLAPRLYILSATLMVSPSR